MDGARDRREVGVKCLKRHKDEPQRKQIHVNAKAKRSDETALCLEMEMCYFSLPGHGSLLLLLGPDPLLEVLQFVTRLQLQPQIALILRWTYNVAKEGRHIEAARFHQMHQINDDAYERRDKSHEAMTYRLNALKAKILKAALSFNPKQYYFMKEEQLFC